MKKKWKLEKGSPYKKGKIGLILLLGMVISTSGCKYTIKQDTYNKIPPSIIQTISEMENRNEVIEEIIEQLKLEMESEKKENSEKQKWINVNEELQDLATTNAELQEYGRFNVAGMKTKDYAKVMTTEWKPVESNEPFQNLSLDLKKSYSYRELENFMKDLSKYNGLDLSIIGKSVKGRNIYNLSLNVNPFIEKKDLILITGQVHAREFAGGMFVLKQFEDLIKKAQTDPYTKLLLENIRIEAVPIVNPDGREEIINGGNVRKKSNANGVDLNRNFPAVSASQVGKNQKTNPLIASKPGLEFFAGYNLGSEPETQALMTWLQIHMPKANFHMDYHQQGRGIYVTKPWNTSSNNQINVNFLNNLLNHINKNAPSRYIRLSDNSNYGFDGSSGTITDYGASVAAGLQFSKKYGRMTLNVNNEELPLLIFKDLKNYSSHYKPINKDFAVATIEIGSGLKALGYNAEARSLMEQEYTKYNFNTLLPYAIELALGPEKVKSLKAEIEAKKEKVYVLEKHISNK